MVNVTKKNKILVFSATYNESKNIKKLIIKIKNNLPNCDILIIDDNSPDKTYEIIEHLKKKIKNINLIIRKSKLGLDTAHKTAYSFAIKNKYEKLITMDADLSHDPSELKKFIRYLDKYQFVIGSRYMNGGKCLMPRKRLILSKYGNLFIKLFLAINATEFTTSYRGFNLKKLNNFNVTKVSAKGYSFFMAVVIEIYKRKFSKKEIPITFRDRLHGKSKIPKFEILRTIIYLLIFRFKKIYE